MVEIEHVLARTRQHAVEYLAGLETRPVGATATLAELRTRLNVPLTTTGTRASRVIDDLVAATDGGHLGSAGGRFFAWVIGGALPSALAADWLVSIWDNNAALYACGPASAVVEEVAGCWIKELLGLPALASSAFTTGCQMAHVLRKSEAPTILILDAADLNVGAVDPFPELIPLAKEVVVNWRRNGQEVERTLMAIAGILQWARVPYGRPNPYPSA
jgi:aromatic-L-amino-acid decarboxylase